VAQSCLWIDWDRHLRTRSLCQRLGIELLEVRIPGFRLMRYLRSTGRTLGRIRAARPAVVIATNPSLVLGLLLLLVRRWYGFALVADGHYAGVRALTGSARLQRLLDFYNARVSLVIVTNEPHALYLRARGCQAFVCPDPLPALPPPAKLALPPRSVFLVCSFDPDEPYEAVFAAFGQLAREGDYTLIVSGNYAKAKVDPHGFPGVRFLGYVPEEQYYAYLQACTLVMDLTMLEDCLLCGAYEALAAGKPLITSASAALRDYFGDAALYTAHEPAAIAASVAQAFAEREELTRRAGSWCARNERLLGERLGALRGALQGLAARTLPAGDAG
jgi:glycosyltransferase involved in cell wall biosynthesis